MTFGGTIYINVPHSKFWGLVPPVIHVHGCLLATADDGQRALAIQMAAYHARVVDKAHNNCVVATPDTPRAPAAAKHVVMKSPSMHTSAASTTHALADATEAASACHGDASDEPREDRSLLTRRSTTDGHRRRYQLDLQTV